MLNLTIIKEYLAIQCGRDIVKCAFEKKRVSGKTQTFQISHDQREHEYTCGAKITALGSCVHKLF